MTSVPSSLSGEPSDPPILWKLKTSPRRVLISAYLNVRKTALAMKQGVFRVLEKPFSDDELMGTVREAIELDQATREQNDRIQEFNQNYHLLDARERMALELILAGHGNKAVEHKLALSTRTVDRIRSSILAKMRYLTFVELATAYGAARSGGAVTK
jgi:two-component system, LuxR family, response regulator FixJ